MIKDQKITDEYAIYESDCMYVLPTLDESSIDLSIYSPPFAGLFNYSSSENDFSNCESREQFLGQYEFLIKEISRVTKPGRITAVHCTDIHNKDGSIWDFPHEIIALHEKHKFKYRNKIGLAINISSHHYGGVGIEKGHKVNLRFLHKLNALI